LTGHAQACFGYSETLRPKTDEFRDRDLVDIDAAFQAAASTSPISR
jgi:hypothetical protein